MDEDPKHAIIIDSGSACIKAGFSDDCHPRAVIPTVVGRLRTNSIRNVCASTNRDDYIGNDAISKRGVLTLTSPIEHGIINNWDDIEKLWHHVLYNELRCHPEEHAILLTEKAGTPKAQREKTTQIFMEGFKVPAIYLAVDTVLSLYASGRTTGIVLDIGHSVTSSTPIYEGYALGHGVNRVDFAGCDLTKFLNMLLTDIGYNFTTSAEQQVVREMKEKMCYVADDYEIECKNSEIDNNNNVSKNYEMPDGQSITLGKERFLVSEALFKPDLYFSHYVHNINSIHPLKGLKTKPIYSSFGYQSENEGIHKMLDNSIRKCSDEIRRDLYNNIVLAGGSTLLPNIDVRLANEIKKLAPASMRCAVTAMPERNYAAFSGGYELARCGTFEEMWVTKDDYDECGPGIVHRRCF